MKQTRHRLEARASDIIQRLPAMGKVMIIGKGKGATHERIGTVETVTEVSGKLVCGGIHHKSSMDPNLIADVIFDISSISRSSGGSSLLQMPVAKYEACLYLGGSLSGAAIDALQLMAVHLHFPTGDVFRVFLDDPARPAALREGVAGFGQSVLL
ncbi:ChuX/HutX family heme-like substrate-binding protein [Rhizobium sp. CECT 9324]|uniref:ChuX/HutX family heme-like substrate-binding protein n=1 Tax=Rhizobium sp. CECT 9324 TaxID=2845820 RepID=UPI001E5CAF2C|nr:ChuX/HutX family heme-like substrate-binding protein [Rhizobium sp. CECT 9324]